MLKTLLFLFCFSRIFLPLLARSISILDPVHNGTESLSLHNETSTFSPPKTGKWHVPDSRLLLDFEEFGDEIDGEDSAILLLRALQEAHRMQARYGAHAVVEDGAFTYEYGDLELSVEAETNTTKQRQAFTYQALIETVTGLVSFCTREMVRDYWETAFYVTVEFEETYSIGPGYLYKQELDGVAPSRFTA